MSTFETERCPGQRSADCCKQFLETTQVLKFQQTCECGGNMELNYEKYLIIQLFS